MVEKLKFKLVHIFTFLIIFSSSKEAYPQQHENLGIYHYTESRLWLTDKGITMDGLEEYDQYFCESNSVYWPYTSGQIVHNSTIQAWYEDWHSKSESTFLKEDHHEDNYLKKNNLAQCKNSEILFKDVIRIYDGYHKSIQLISPSRDTVVLGRWSDNIFSPEVLELTDMNDVMFEVDPPILKFSLEEYVVDPIGLDKVCKRCNLANIDLSYKSSIQDYNLAESDLFNADFTGLNLTSINLKEALLVEANLSSTTLNKANLDGANLSRSDLSYALIVDTHFKGVDFNQATLQKARLNQLDLSRGKLTGVILKDAVLTEVDLFQAALSKANLSGAIFIRVNLAGSDLSLANLSNANLSNINLSGANLSEANLSGADLSGADLSGADLSRAKLLNTNFSGANLAGADISNTDLSQSNFSGANLAGANFSNSKLDASILKLNARSLAGAQVDKNTVFLGNFDPKVYDFIETDVKYNTYTHSAFPIPGFEIEKLVKVTNKVPESRLVIGFIFLLVLFRFILSKNN